MPSDPLHIIQEVEELMHFGEMDLAIQLLNEELPEYPNNYNLISLLGECYLSNGEPEKAIKPLIWATKNHPKPDKSKNESNESEELSIEKIQQTMGIAQRDESWVDYYLLGCAYGRCMQFEKGMKNLKKADKLFPNNAEIIRNIGWIQCMQNNKDKGRKNLHRAIKIDPSIALTYNDLGASYLFEGNITEAKKWVSKAREIDPFDLFIISTADKLEELSAYSTLFGEKPITSPKEFFQE